MMSDLMSRKVLLSTSLVRNITLCHIKIEMRSLFGQFEMCFIFVEQINVMFMQPLYEAVILFDCIINQNTINQV